MEICLPFWACQHKVLHHTWVYKGSLDAAPWDLCATTILSVRALHFRMTNFAWRLVWCGFFRLTSVKVLRFKVFQEPPTNLYQPGSGGASIGFLAVANSFLSHAASVGFQPRFLWTNHNTLSCLESLEGLSTMRPGLRWCKKQMRWLWLVVTLFYCVQRQSERQPQILPDWARSSGHGQTIYCDVIVELVRLGGIVTGDKAGPWCFSVPGTAGENV